ncbi:undecaprenyl-diphosphatase [Caldanaerovirga acetigignens]|uniref:Undecaprenyl-diphosphatase n=1 Tax=Caldanaerovirga acetigignens TaxID=447595 RepID=A0A1M7HCS9_9FIRM|nr:phosphatase PAP2 family protein [Caldanaerovirga acetigignens]SHM26239.1 undecaprenyl-diphosphatase [Caldanaerovirga acetigignens]
MRSFLGKIIEGFHQKDKNLFMYLNQRIKCRPLDAIMPRITHLGGATFSVLLCAFLYIFGKEEARIAASEAFFALTGSQGIVQIFKKSIYRKRPYMVLPNVNTFWRKLLKDHSFPSGHTVAGFCLAVVFSLYFPAYRYAIYSLATLVGFSRIYTGMHYPSDVLSGAFLGTTFALLTHAIKKLIVS